MTGWRLGYIAADPEIAKACEKVRGSSRALTSSHHPESPVVVPDRDLAPSFEMVENLLRPETAMELLARHSGHHLCEQNDDVLFFPDVSSLLRASRMGRNGHYDFLELLQLPASYRARVPRTGRTLSVAGSLPCVRFSFANRMGNIEQDLGACERACLN